MNKLLGNLKNVSSLLNNDMGDQEVWLDLNLIDPDPEQPRKIFDEEQLKNLSLSMTYVNPKTNKQRGNKQAIVVRPNLEKEGRYIIVMGERRYRAAILGNMNKIRARIDNNYFDQDEIEDDQMVENIQNASLHPKEIANWIAKKLKQGKKKSELAQTLGKSNSFITQYAALLALPGVIEDLFKTGKCNDVTLLNDLATLHKKHPDEVENWVNDDSEVNRNSFKLFKEFLDTKKDKNIDEQTEKTEISETPEKEHSSSPKKNDTSFKKAIVMVEHIGQPARLVLNRRPSSDKTAWIKYTDSGEEFEVQVKDLEIKSIIEG